MSGDKPAKDEVPGICVACRVDVLDPIGHNLSDSHQAKVRVWEKAVYGPRRRERREAGR